MSQQVLEHTRGKKHLRYRDNNNEGLIRNLQVGEPFSDHNPTAFDPSHKKVNLDMLNELFNFVPWTCAFFTDDVQENWLMFKDLLFTAVETCIPIKSPRKMKNAPRLTPDLLTDLAEKICLQKCQDIKF